MVLLNVVAFAVLKIQHNLVSILKSLFASFIKARFYLKRGCMKMRKHTETFHAIKECKLAIVFFIAISLFSKQKLRRQFSNVICTKTRLAHLYFLHENESIQHCLSYYLRRMTTFLALEISFSKGSVFSQIQGPGPVLGQCTKR